MSSLSNHNANNTRSVTLTPSSLASSLKVQSTLKFVIRGVLLPKLIWWPMSLIPLIRFSASERRTYIVAMILLLSKIMPTCSYCILKGLVYIIIIFSLSCQSFFYTKCIKLNMRSSCDIRLVFNTKCIYLMRSCIL